MGRAMNPACSGTWFPIIETGACIEFMVHSTTTTVAQIQGTLFLAED